MLLNLEVRNKLTGERFGPVPEDIFRFAAYIKRDVDDETVKQRIEMKPCLEALHERYLGFSRFSNEKLSKMLCLDPQASSVHSFVDLSDSAPRLEIELEACIQDYPD